jgi:hypothetical protein
MSARAPVRGVTYSAFRSLLETTTAIRRLPSIRQSEACVKRVIDRFMCHDNVDPITDVQALHAYIHTNTPIVIDNDCYHHLAAIHAIIRRLVHVHVAIHALRDRMIQEMNKMPPNQTHFSEWMAAQWDETLWLKGIGWPDSQSRQPSRLESAIMHWVADEKKAGIAMWNRLCRAHYTALPRIATKAADALMVPVWVDQPVVIPPPNPAWQAGLIACRESIHAIIHNDVVPESSVWRVKGKPESPQTMAVVHQLYRMVRQYERESLYWMARIQGDRSDAEAFTLLWVALTASLHRYRPFLRLYEYSLMVEVPHVAPTSRAYVENHRRIHHIEPILQGIVAIQGCLARQTVTYNPAWTRHFSAPLATVLHNSVRPWHPFDWFQLVQITLTQF